MNALLTKPANDNDFSSKMPPVEMTDMFSLLLSSIAAFIEFVITVSSMSGSIFAMYQAVVLASRMIRSPLFTYLAAS